MRFDEIFKPVSRVLVSPNKFLEKKSVNKDLGEAVKSNARQQLEKLSQKNHLALEATAVIYPSLAVSLLDRYLLGIPLLNRDKQLIGNTVHSQGSFKDTVHGNDVLHTTVLKGVLGNNYLSHDLEHFLAITDGAPKHISGSFVEMLTTAFHRAIDSFYDRFKSGTEDALAKASFLTTRDRNPDTFADYVKYLDKATEIYTKVLSSEDTSGNLKYEKLINNILHLNYGMKEAFEELTLHGQGLRNKNMEPSIENGTGFCLLPQAIKEIGEIHNAALSELKSEIKEPKLVAQISAINTHLDLISF